MDEKEARTRLFSVLDDVLSVSHKKFNVKNKQEKERRAWARILLQSIQVYGKLLDGEKLEELSKRLDKIEENL